MIVDIRIIVLNELPLSQRNAALAFFTFDAEKVKFALENYDWTYEDGSTLINQLLKKYNLEGIDMSYTIEDFRHDVAIEYLESLEPREVIERVNIEKILKSLDIEEILKNLDAVEILKSLRTRDIENYLKMKKKR